MLKLFDHASYSKKCREFVTRVCGKRTDESHSVKHMERVVKTSLEILKENYAGESGRFWCITVICAWLHDVCDKKYAEENNEQEMRAFLKTINLKELNVEPEHIFKITSYCSFSTENKALMAGAPLDFEKLLSDDQLAVAHIIRDIVSDADKYDAIGDYGVVRADQTSRHLYTAKHGTKPDNLTIAGLVNDHTEEKLLRLYKFFRTPHGKKIAKTATKVFVKKLEEYNKLAGLNRQIQCDFEL